MAHPIDFKDEACDILLGKGKMSDRAYQTALGFIPTMRMKKWKPRQGTDSNKTFCYMNIDSTKDYWFTFPNDRACSMGLFGDTPIIKQVFSNVELDNTSSFPFNKCVFEVDTTNVNDTTLTTFWSNIDQIDCASLYAGYQYSNAVLTNEIAELNQIKHSCNVFLQQLNDNISHLSNVVVSCNAQIESLEERIYNLEQTNTGILENLYVTVNAIDVITAQYGDYRKSCEITINAWTQSNTVMLDNVYAASNYDAQMIVINNQLTKKLSDLWGTYSVNVAYTETLSNEYMTMYNKNVQYMSWNTDLQGQLTSCKNIVADITNQTRQYTSMYNGEQNNNANLNNQLTKLTVALNDCQSQLSQCSTTQSGLITQNDQLIVRYQQCEDALNKCMAIQQGLISQSNQLGIAIVNWLHTYVRCDDIIKSIDNVKTQIDATSSTCRVTDQAIYDKLLADTKTVQTKGMLDNVNACVADVNNISMSLPAQPDAGTPPTLPKEHNTPSDAWIQFCGDGNCDGDWVTAQIPPGDITWTMITGAGAANTGVSAVRIHNAFAQCYHGGNFENYAGDLGPGQFSTPFGNDDNSIHSVRLHRLKHDVLP